MTITVVIPTLNEASRIDAAIASVSVQDPPWEVLVVDGGSDDDTVTKCDGLATVLHSPRGRAKQMNVGWRAARGQAVLFLHADTTLPKAAFTEVRRCLADQTAEGGIFRLQFDASHPLLNLFSYGSRIKTVCTCFGDRGIFGRRDTLEKIGERAVNCILIR